GFGIYVIAGNGAVHKVAAVGDASGSQRILNLHFDQDNALSGNRFVFRAELSDGTEKASVVTFSSMEGRRESLGQRETLEGIDIGFKALPGEIHGVVFQDSNHNGQQDASEPALPDWTIFLDSNQNGILD